VVAFGEQRRGLVGQPQPPLVLPAGHLAGAVGPLPHGAGLFHPAEVGDQLGAQQVS